MKKNRQNTELKYLKRQSLVPPSIARLQIRHQERGVNAGRMRGA